MAYISTSPLLTPRQMTSRQRDYLMLRASGQGCNEVLRAHFRSLPARAQDELRALEDDDWFMEQLNAELRRRGLEVIQYGRFTKPNLLSSLEDAFDELEDTIAEVKEPHKKAALQLKKISALTNVGTWLHPSEQVQSLKHSVNPSAQSNLGDHGITEIPIVTEESAKTLSTDQLRQLHAQANAQARQSAAHPPQAQPSGEYSPPNRTRIHPPSSPNTYDAPEFKVMSWDDV